MKVVRVHSLHTQVCSRNVPASSVEDPPQRGTQGLLLTLFIDYQWSALHHAKAS